MRYSVATSASRREGEVSRRDGAPGGPLPHSLLLTHSSSSQPHALRHAHPPCPRRPHDRPDPRCARPSVPRWPHPRPRPPPPTRPTATWAGVAPTSSLAPGASSASAWKTGPCGAGSPGSSTCGATRAPRSVASRRPGAPSTSGESHSSGFLSSGLLPCPLLPPLLARRSLWRAELPSLSLCRSWFYLCFQLMTRFLLNEVSFLYQLKFLASYLAFLLN